MSMTQWHREATAQAAADLLSTIGIATDYKMILRVMDNDLSYYAPTLDTYLARTRYAKGWSQDTLARLAGVSRPTISNLETSKSLNLSVETLMRLAKALEVPLVTMINAWLESAKQGGLL